MQKMDDLDLNLLTALDALLEARSVTRAALRLRRSQPAVSRALGRLREQLGDPLLVRRGNAMTPTPRGQRLAGPLRQALAAVQQAVAPQEAFSPATSRRVFRLATADYGVATVVPALLTALARAAPLVELTVTALDGAVDAALETNDLVLVPRRASAAGVVWTRLFREDFVLVARRGTFESGVKAVTLDQLCAHPHVFVGPSGQPEGVLDELLRARGRRRRTALRVPTFLAGAPVVAQSGLVCVLPRRIAAHAHDPRLQTLELPVALPGFTLECAWQERMRQDPEHAWFRRLLVDVARG